MSGVAGGVEIEVENEGEGWIEEWVASFLIVAPGSLFVSLADVMLS